MNGSSAFIVLAWGVLWTATTHAAALDTPGAGAAVRRIEVQAGMLVTPPEVRISPGLSTTLFFDARIRPDQLVLEGRERFQRFGVTEDHLVLVPSATFREGERLRLEARFHDGSMPERAVVVLVVDTARAERQIELYRHARSAASYRQEVEELRAGMLRLERQVQLLQHARGGGEYTRERVIAEFRDEGAFTLQYWSPRKATGDVVPGVVAFVRLSPRWGALRLMPSKAGQWDGWSVVGAVLTDAQGKRLKTLPPWNEGPPEPDGRRPIIIIVDEPESADKGRYTLELWDEGRKRSLRFEGLRPR